MNVFNESCKNILEKSGKVFLERMPEKNAKETPGKENPGRILEGIPETSADNLEMATKKILEKTPKKLMKSSEKELMHPRSYSYPANTRSLLMIFFKESQVKLLEES